MTPIIEKLKKLIAHEESARTIGNTAEAESFATKIQEMLARHKLSMSEVEAEAEDRVNPIGVAASRVNTAKPERWAELLAAGIAVSLYCQFLTRDGSGRLKARVVFVGRESDREAAVLLFNYLHTLGIEIAQEQARTLKADPNIILAVERIRAEGFSDAGQALNKLARRYKRDFLLGYATALYRRLLANKANIESAAPATAAGLIMRNTQAVEEYCRKRYEITEHRTRATKVMANAFGEGYQAGENVSIAARGQLPEAG